MTKRTLLVVALVALGTQIAYLAEGRNDPTFDAPIVDAGVYHELAQRLARGEPMTDEAFYQPPLFPIVLGCLYAAVGPSILAAKVLLALLAAASCLLVAWLGRRLFDEGVGRVAGILLALYGPFVLISTQLLPVGLAIFLDLLALAIWVSCIGSPRWRKWLAFGGAAGLATITVPNAAVLPVLAIGDLLLRAARDRRGAPIGWASAVALGVAVPIGSVALRNFSVSGRWVWISTNGGLNFYVGNNPDWEKTVAVRPGERWQRLVREAAVAGATSGPDRDAFFYRRGFDFISAEPLVFLRGLTIKSLQFVNARELPRNIDPYGFREFSRVLRILMWRAGPLAFPFGLLAPLAVAGVYLALPQRDESGAAFVQRQVVAAFILAYATSVVLFFVSSRYRMPVIPPLLIFAAAAIRRGWRTVGRPAATSTRTTFVCIMAVVALVSNVPLRSWADEANLRAELWMAVGDFHATHASPVRAEECLHRALQERPDYAEAAAKLAALWADRGELDDAERLLRDAIPWDADLVESRVVLATVMRRRGDLAEAESLLLEGLRIDPTSPEAHAAYADVLRTKGDTADAIARYATAIHFGDRKQATRVRLGDALADEGLYGDAIVRYRDALTFGELDAETLNRIAWLMATCPDTAQRDCRAAIQLARQACHRTEFQNPVAIDTLAAAHAECREFSEAVRWVRRAIDLAERHGDAAAVESFRSRLAIYERLLTRPDQRP